MKFIKTIVLINLLTLSSFLLSGCYTVAGFGKDVQAGGKAITRAASH